MQTLSARTRRTHLGTWSAGLLVTLALTPTLWAQGMRDLVEAALDEKIAKRVEITEQPIREALGGLEKATGLRFVLDKAVVEWMPYGEQTRISIVMEDISVRRALGRIFDGLGLALRVADDRVAVEPAAWLGRLGRRLTIEEAELFQKLAAGPWSGLKPDDVVIEFRLSPKDDPRQMFEQAMKSAPPGNALAQLEAATQGLGWLWVPAGHTIVIYSRSEDIQQRLDRPLDMSYRRMALDELLLDLGRRIDVTIHFEPGVLQRVAARDRNVDLIQRGMTVRQALELIGGNTGLVYDVVEDGIVIGPPPPTTAAADAPSNPTPRVVAILRVPVGTDGTTIEFLIRENDLPPEFKQLLERKMPQVLELLRKDAGN